MHILVLNWQDIANPLGGGAEVHLHEIFKRVAQRGHTVSLLCCSVPGRPDYEEIDGIHIYRRGSRSLFNFVLPAFYREFVETKPVDVVIDDINKIPFYTPWFVNKPLFAMAHHLFGSSIYRETNPVSATYVYAAEKLIPRVYRHVQFAVVSESTRQELASMGISLEQQTIIGNCIEPAALPMQVGAKHESPVVTYFGRLKKYKCVDHVVQAFAQLRASAPTAQLWLMGRGDFEEDLKKQVHSLGLADCTTFWGFVSEEQKVELLSASWAVVNPSPKEGWGITNIEANGCGTPVVSADSPGLRDSVKDGHSGVLYPHGNIGALSTALQRIVNDTEWRESLQQGSIAWANTFDWNDSAERMEAMCERVISAHNQSDKQ